MTLLVDVILSLKVDILLETSTFNSPFINPLIKRVENYLTRNKLVSSGQTIIIGLSGGPDSVFLLYLFAALKNKFDLHIVAAHLDHGWRTNSPEDVQFCHQLTTHLGITYVHEHATNIQLEKPSKGSLEEQGRALRRTFFAQIAAQYNAQAIALGHHADDQQETFFIRLMRGAGVAGLAGIKPRDGIIIHPLLCCSKQEILEFLTAHHIQYLTDPTNSDNHFLRNCIRNNLLPALRSCDARFDASLARTMERLKEADDFIASHTTELLHTLLVEQKGARWIAIDTLFDQHPYVQKQLLIHWFIAVGVPFTPSTNFFNEVLRFLQNKRSNQHTFYQTWNILKKANKATITFCA
jgi:tRNA(Ile)-lysidine synthase